MSDVIEIWFKCRCKKCGEMNWVYSGYFPDPDMSKLDVVCFECWNCRNEQPLVEEETFGGYTGKGQRLPS